MVNLDTLPKVIIFNDDYYALHLGVTFKNKLTTSYYLSGDIKRAIAENREITILSQVVEPKMNYPINYSDDIRNVVDVPNYELAFNVLSSRLNTALSKGEVKIFS